jgi:hypothetical protein
MYNLHYVPTTLGVQSWREIISGGTRTKKVEYHWLYNVEWKDDRWIMNCKGCGRKWSWLNFRCYPGICLKVLRKTTRYLGVRRLPGTRCPKCRGVLTTRCTVLSRCILWCVISGWILFLVLWFILRKPVYKRLRMTDTSSQVGEDDVVQEFAYTTTVWSLREFEGPTAAAFSTVVSPITRYTCSWKSPRYGISRNKNNRAYG